MDFVTGFLKVVIIYILFRSVFNIFNQFKKASKIKNKDMQQAYFPKEDKAKVEAKEVIPTMVVDDICGRTIERPESYIIVKDGIEHYFCSWTCREKFVNT